MLKKTAIASAIGLIAAAGSLQADTPSFNYLQLDYIASGEVQDDKGVLGDDADVERGYAVGGAFEVGQYFYVAAETLDIDYDGQNIIGSDQVTLSDMTLVGVGAHMPVAELIELYGQLGLARTSTLAGFDGDGYGYKLGARANVGMVELGLSYMALDTEADFIGTDIDVLPSLLNLGVVLNFAPDAPQLVLGYSTGTLEFDGSGADAEFDMEFWSIGIRKTFN